MQPKRSHYRRLVRFLKPYWKHATVSMVSMTLFALLSGAMIWMIGPLAGTLFGLGGKSVMTAQTPDSANQTGTPELLKPYSGLKAKLKAPFERFFHHPDKLTVLERLCIAVLLIVVLKSLFFYLQGYLMAYVQQSVIRDLRNTLYRHYHTLSLSFFNKARTGQLISRITNDVAVVNEMLEMALTRLVRDPILVIIFIFILLVISWQLTLVAFVAFPLLMLGVSQIGKAIHRYSQRSQERIADVNAAIQEAVSGVRVVKAFGAERYEVAKFEALTKAYRKVMLKMGRVRILSSPINEILATAAGVVILWFGGKQVLSGHLLKPEDFLLYLFAMFSLIAPAKSLSLAHAKVQEGMAAAARIFEIIDTAPHIVEDPQAQPVTGFRLKIVFADVSFRYDTGPWVLRDINLSVNAGEVVAVVGPSGSGKSTLVDLLSRFYDPTEGSIALDGLDLRRIKTGSLRTLIGIVTQETILFHDTVFNNIAYGLEGVTELRVKGAAEAANAADFIEKLDHGYQTIIGDRGVRLSGGQRQRLAIARALLKNPPILIFDEATSALDSESERLVQEAIARLVTGRTTFLIAHRLSSVLRADRIIVLEHGRIVEAGSHSDLLARGGKYHRLYEMQFRDAR